MDEGPVLSFGLNVGGGYGELDMPLDVDLADMDGGNAESGTIWLEAPAGALGPNDVVLRDGQTHQVTATYDADSGAKQIWIDGVLRWSVDLGGDVTSGGGAVAYIGSVNGGENWTGVIDEFAFWNRALDAAEIQTHYGNVLDGLNYFGIGSVPGDFDGDGVLTTADIDLLTNASATNSSDSQFDLNGDAVVDQADVELWITGDAYAKSWVGDADVNGEFNSSDLVLVLSAGNYETEADAVWSTGDFNGDGRSNSSDLVAALSNGGYEQGPRAAVSAVPEPNAAACLWLGGLMVALHRRRRGAA